MKRTFIVFLVLFVGRVWAQSDMDVFQQANKAYKDGDYATALEQYNNLLEQGNVSADLYYNLGNTYYKLNQIAPSIYNYEKALLINPNLEDVKNNLNFAERMRIDAFEELPKSVFQKFNGTVIYPISHNTWAWLSVLFAFVITGFFLLYYFSKYTSKKRLYFVLSFVALALFLILLSFSIKSYHHFKNDQPAIVFSTKVAVKSEPNITADESFVLHEGTKVQIKETVEGWYKIKLSDGKIGWLRQADVKPLKKPD
jgi:tetratricopeptide (TPR) repeat protein